MGTYLQLRQCTQSTQTLVPSRSGFSEGRTEKALVTTSRVDQQIRTSLLYLLHSVSIAQHLVEYVK